MMGAYTELLPGGYPSANPDQREKIVSGGEYLYQMSA